ncbi:MAG: energy transducer TonB [Acidobacteria bacterium]|nr:energy transducer TonB [Acidobacteriota bacterium]
MGLSLNFARSNKQEDRKSASTKPAGSFSYASWLCILLLAMAVGTGAEQDRKLIKKVDPEYPAIAKKLSLQGTVRVEITIATEGTVKSVVTLGGNPILVQAVEEAVKQWKYSSGPEETKKTLDFKF